jgi:hypothetical protein
VLLELNQRGKIPLYLFARAPRDARNPLIKNLWRSGPQSPPDEKSPGLGSPIDPLHL